MLMKDAPKMSKTDLAQLLPNVHKVVYSVKLDFHNSDHLSIFFMSTLNSLIQKAELPFQQKQTVVNNRKL